MSADDARKLFVGGLSDAATEEELRGIFTSAGFVVAHLAVPRDRETGRLRGFAFVTLSTEEEAHEARAKVQGQLCGGRPLSIREFSQGPQKGGSVRPRAEEPTVFLGKLPFDATQEEITEFFGAAGVGPVVRVTLPVGPDGRPRGFGFATLETQEAATQAVQELNGAALRGRSIVVSPAQPRGAPGGAGGAPAPRRPTGGDPDPYQGGSYQSRGPRAVREPEPGYFPSELPPMPPPEDAEGRRRRPEPRKEKKAAERRKGEGGGQKAGRRPRGGASSWQQWNRDDD